jgi:hypothetical protein
MSAFKVILFPSVCIFKSLCPQLFAFLVILSPTVANDWQNNRPQVICYHVLQARGRKHALGICNMEDAEVDPGFSSIYNLSVWVLGFFFEDGGGGMARCG